MIDGFGSNFGGFGGGMGGEGLKWGDRVGDGRPLRLRPDAMGSCCNGDGKRVVRNKSIRMPDPYYSALNKPPDL